jgi:hypothetical protein
MLSDIGNYLQAQGIGTLGTNIFLGLMPDQPDNCIALFEYAGSPPDLHWNGEYPGLQVRVRNKSYEAARSKIGDIVKKLHGLYEQILSDEVEPEGIGDEGEGNGEEELTPVTGTRYLLIKARGSPEVLKRDNNNRVELFVNFEIIKERD